MLTSIATISYAAATLAFLLLSVLLLTSWRGRMYGMVLTVACLLSVLWAAALTYQAVQEIPRLMLADILEVLRNAGWSVFLVMLLMPFRQASSKTSNTVQRNTVVMTVIAGLYLVFCLIVLYAYQNGKPDHSIVIGVAMAIIGMILVEQLYRNTSVKERWGIKFACLGIGSIFAYDFYLYSDALLFRQVNSDIWAARGIVNMLVVPLVAISAARNPQWSLGIGISRSILFYSAALFGTAIYLLVMAAAGYYLRFSGGSWGTILQVAFLFGAVILLIGVLFSGTIRSWLRVFISKHFFSYNYDYREEWLRFTRMLSEGESELGVRVVEALAQLVESPGGGLWVHRDAGNYEPAAHWNMPLAKGSEAGSSSFCQFLQEKAWVIDLEEYSQDPEKYTGLDLPSWLHAIPKAWLVIPLAQNRRLFGFIVLAEPRSTVKLNWEVFDLLKVAGNQAVSYLAQYEAANALLIARQFESFNRMSAFVVHDLKNLVAQLSLLLNNAEKHKKNPEFQEDMIETVYLSVQKMKRLLEKLSSRGAIEIAAALSVDRLLQEAVTGKSMHEPVPVLEIRHAGLMVFANLARLDRVIGHLIQNAIEATPKQGEVVVFLEKQRKSVVIGIRDTGHGMSEEFIRDRLFKPFETTKSAGMGIGVFESREYINELGGKLEVTSVELQGTTFRVILPIHEAGHATEASAQNQPEPGRVENS